MKTSKTNEMRKAYLETEYIDYLCGFYSNELQPVNFEEEKMISDHFNREIDLTPSLGIYSDNFSDKLTREMIIAAINKLFDEHGLFCLRQGEVSRENLKAWFAMVYPEIYPYDDMEYAIGWRNKKLRSKRQESEIIWKENYKKVNNVLVD